MSQHIGVFILMSFLVFSGIQQAKASESLPDLKSRSASNSVEEENVERESRAKERRIKDYVRIKLLYKEGEIANRVGLAIICEKFKDSSYDRSVTKDDLEKRKTETQRRIGMCLELLPANSVFQESGSVSCSDHQCFFRVKATEAGLDAVYRDQDLHFIEDMPETRIPNVSKSERVRKRDSFMRNPPIDIPTTLSEILNNLPDKQKISISGHYKDADINKKILSNGDDLKKEFKGYSEQKKSIAVECNGDKFFKPFSGDKDSLYGEVERRMEAIMADVPRKAQGREFFILNPTKDSTCSFVVKANEVGLENLLNDKRVTEVHLVKEEVPQSAIFKRKKPTDTMNQPSKN